MFEIPLRDRSKIRGGRAGAFLFWPTSFGETLPIPGAEKMLNLQNRGIIGPMTAMARKTSRKNKYVCNHV